jgi:Cu/Ag efflux pump CusA
MLPIAIGLGTDPSFRAPMAIVVIGGLITSTFISLLVIPVIFSVVDDLLDWSRRTLHRRRTGGGPAKAEPAVADIH